MQCFVDRFVSFFLFVIMLSALLWFTDSYCSFCIVKIFLNEVKYTAININRRATCIKFLFSRMCNCFAIFYIVCSSVSWTYPGLVFKTGIPRESVWLRMSHIINCASNVYSQTCFKRQSFRQWKCGLSRQVVS